MRFSKATRPDINSLVQSRIIEDDFSKLLQRHMNIAEPEPKPDPTELTWENIKYFRKQYDCNRLGSRWVEKKLRAADIPITRQWGAVSIESIISDLRGSGMTLRDVVSVLSEKSHFLGSA